MTRWKVGIAGTIGLITVLGSTYALTHSQSTLPAPVHKRNELETICLPAPNAHPLVGAIAEEPNAQYGLFVTELAGQRIRLDSMAYMGPQGIGMFYRDSMDVLVARNGLSVRMPREVSVALDSMQRKVLRACTGSSVPYTSQTGSRA